MREGAQAAFAGIGVLITSGWAAAAEAGAVIRVTADGSFLEEIHGTSPTATGGGLGPPASSGVDVVWHNQVAGAIYTTTGITLAEGAEGRVAAGTELNPPLETQLIPLDGDGTPDWTFAGQESEVDASRDGDVVASVEFVSATTSVNVRKWTAGAATPDWTASLAGVTPAGNRAIAVSPDGSTIAVLVTVQGAPLKARAVYYDSASSTPLGSVDADDATFARSLSISEDGKYIAFMAAATVYVVDRDADALRYGASAGASNDAVAISGDGTLLAYGWTTLFVRQWNGSTYGPLWSASGAGHILGECDISTDGSTLVTGWFTFGFDQNRVDLYELPSSTPLWTYTYPLAAGPDQQIVDDVAVTADGSHAAVASWGDDAGLIPRIHVFEHDGPTPVTTVDTPGSMFDVDIAKTASGSVHVTACGKNVHANDFGSGGDLYSIRIETGDGGCIADITGPDGVPDGMVAVSDLVAVILQWGGPGDADISGPGGEPDGVVDVVDLIAVITEWGPCPR